MLSPIALFVYNRPVHTKFAIEQLSKCKRFGESSLFVFSDGPKTRKDITAVTEVRNLVRRNIGKHVHLVEAKENQGLARSVINGVSRLCNAYGRAIVLEDDLLVSPYFLEYMNAALNKYEKNDTVMQVSGHMFPVKAFYNRKEALFLPFTTSWGWGTWERAWQQFDVRARGWDTLYSHHELRASFNLDGMFDYFSMLERQMRRGGNSWAIRWYWSVFKNKVLVVFPPVTLVRNIGLDGSGTHGWRNARKAFRDTEFMTSQCSFPDDLKVDKDNLEEVKVILGSIGKGFVISRLFHYIRNYLKK